ncbi:DUF885 domain-containing protein [Arenicella xantha]|uniref:Uncharacterized protein (DUF885 family) n=1 Tax=Arenicella xantha TaxID=644221 RepID=A0A395JJV4_9GAMM|nr:DUF885 domain-containing protein [Arenicella xantha]RBP49078.1 uncharacterized protein (DUF885 family) [Arenicella xantha]
MKIQLVTPFIILVLLAACSESPRPDTSEAELLLTASPEAEPNVVSETTEVTSAVEPSLDQNAAFNQFKENFLERTWALNPSYGVYVGFYKYDDVLMVPDGELRGRRRAFYVNELRALKAFNANRLTASNATDLAIIEGQLRSSLWYIDSFRSFEWNPAQYNPAGAFGVILNTDYKPLKERILTISKRLENVPAYYSAAIANLKVPTEPHLGLAIQQTKGALGMFTKLIPEKASAVELSPEESAAFDTNLAAAVSAVSNYAEWLDAKQAELAETGEVRSFRIGAELYEKKFKHDIASSYTAQELYQLAVASKTDLHNNMIAITEELWPKYFAEEAIPENRLVAVKQLIDLLAKRHVERDQFVDEIRRQIPILQAFVDEHELLDSDPTRPLVVRLTPEYQRGFAGASVNAPGPYDATANTYYNVSPLDDYTEEQAESYLREYNHWILQILNIHEAIPGHYTQLMHANKSPSKIKSVFGNGAMVEGWAVYSERMMLEAGYANNEPEMWLMYSKWNLRVVVNTILDYSVQVLGMEREAALDMLMNEAFQERTEAEGKWRRATVSQVQLTSYFTGYSEIYAFREELKAKMGEAFNLRDFHNKFLSYGNAPVPVIKKLMLNELAALPQKSASDVEQPLLDDSVQSLKVEADKLEQPTDAIE